MERLQKVIAQAGICSRRHAEELIAVGRVEVNGIVINTLGYKVNLNDEIKVDGRIITKEKHEYYLLYKPSKVLCSLKESGNKKLVTSFINSEKRLYPVGRLDFLTQGLIIITNDGNFAAKLMHPSSVIEKTYLAKLDKKMKKEDALILSHGIIIDDKKTLPAKVQIENNNYVKITITEGRNRQVRKMLQKLGYYVSELTRTQIAFLSIDKLKPGKYRRLTSTEITRILAL